MTKKFKIKDLEIDPDGDGRTRADFTKISLDDLSDEVKVVPNVVTAPAAIEKALPPLPVPEIRTIKEEKVDKAKSEIKEKVIPKVEVSKDQVSLQRKQLYVYLFKVLSFATIVVALDVAIHFLKFFEHVDVLKIENFDSILIGVDLKWNVIYLFSFLSGVYLITPDEKLIMSRVGIQCRRVDVMNMFFTSTKVMLTWDEIITVKYKVKLFEPYLFFYGANEEAIGQVALNLESPKEFFQLVEKYAGRAHPLFKIQSSIV